MHEERPPLVTFTGVYPRPAMTAPLHLNLGLTLHCDFQTQIKETQIL